MENPAAARLRLAFDLFEVGVRLMRQNLRRRHPGESAEQIERRLAAWLATRPGAASKPGVTGTAHSALQHDSPDS